jgi:hypothetical protein
MPRIQLWNNAKTQDYHFQDRVIREAIDAGGTTILIHKYLGPAPQGETGDPAQPNLAKKDVISELDIQDVLFMENRDRIYDTTVYELRGSYNVSDQDFDLSQFGLFLNADTLFITFHTNDMVDRLGRKLMAGDVIEIPHLNDDLLLDATAKSINKFYAVQDAARAAEGFGPTWWPHLWRIKAAPINDAQEYRNILGNPEDEDSLKNALSTYQKEIEISNTIIESAEKLVPNAGWKADNVIDPPKVYGFDGSGESGLDVNWVPDSSTVQAGLTFPSNPTQGDFFMRTDFLPNRLFVYRGTRWHRVYDSVEQTGWKESRLNASTFINNENTTSSKNPDTGSVPERQALSQVFRKTPKTDE